MKDKAVGGIEKIILKSFYATSKELAQAIRDSLVVDEGEVEKILNELLYEMPQAKYKYHLQNIRKLAKKIAKGNIIKAKP